MSLQSGKDGSIQFSKLTLSNLSGNDGLILKQKDVEEDTSKIYQDDNFVLTIENDSYAGIAPSDIAFLANDTAGVQQTPLFLSGDGCALSGVCTVNGIPIGTAGTENIEDVLIIGDDANGQSIVGLNDVGLVSINGTPYVAQTSQTITNLLNTPIAQAGIAQSSTHVAYQSAVFPAGNYIVNVSTDVFSTDHGAGVDFTDGYIELRDNVNTSIAVFSNFSTNIGTNTVYPIWAYGTALTLLWTSTGANIFQVITNFTLSNPVSTYEVASGGIIQIVKIA